MNNSPQISGECINAVAVAFANGAAKGLTTDELERLAILFNLIGDAFGVIAAFRSSGEKAC